MGGWAASLLSNPKVKMKLTYCARCQAKLPDDGRFRYCTKLCFQIARRQYEIKRTLTRKRYWHESEQGKKYEIEYRSRPEVRERKSLINHARYEARERGVGTADILREWKAKVGKVPEKGDTRYNPKK